MISTDINVLLYELYVWLPGVMGSGGYYPYSIFWHIEAEEKWCLFSTRQFWNTSDSIKIIPFYILV